MEVWQNEVTHRNQQKYEPTRNLRKYCTIGKHIWPNASLTNHTYRRALRGIGVHHANTHCQRSTRQPQLMAGWLASHTRNAVPAVFAGYA